MHTGFEGSGTLPRLWAGELLHKVIRVEFRRIPRSEIPPDAEARVKWLREEWQRVDTWVARHRSR
jgi:hypothetical protein